jgi:hypothetical protein
MSKHIDIEELKKNIYKYSVETKINLELQLNVSLANGNLADIVILLDKKIVALGNYYSEKLEKQPNEHFYFHNHPFIAGGFGNCWFFFNGENFVFHEIWFDYPEDNFTNSIEEILERSLNHLNK